METQTQNNFCSNRAQVQSMPHSADAVL